MTFTDEDLKRFRQYTNSGKLYDEYALEYKALLARLESAERCIEFVATCCDCLRLDAEQGPYKAWRKAAGK